MATVKKPAAPAKGSGTKKRKADPTTTTTAKKAPAKTPKTQKTQKTTQRKTDAEAARKRKAEAVLRGMRAGASCFQACKKVGIAHSTFFDWVKADKGLADNYARAREDLIELIAAQTLEIADAEVGFTDMGSTDAGAVQKQRLQVDTRKWLLSKLAPRKYGDRMMLVGDEDNPVAVKSTLDVKKLSTETLEEILRAQDEHAKSA